MRTKTKLILASIALFTITSCGGSKEEKDEKKEMTLCDCMGLKDKYDSKEDAEKELGKEKIDKCMDLVKVATEEEIKNCQ